MQFKGLWALYPDTGSELNGEAEQRGRAEAGLKVAHALPGPLVGTLREVDSPSHRARMENPGPGSQAGLESSKATWGL